MLKLNRELSRMNILLKQAHSRFEMLSQSANLKTEPAACGEREMCEQTVNDTKL